MKKKQKLDLSFNKLSVLELNQLKQIKGGNDNTIHTILVTIISESSKCDDDEPLKDTINSDNDDVVLTAGTDDDKDSGVFGGDSRPAMKS